ncbi:MAG: hypothetical protein MR281_05665 [Eubacterium sp.]|nr:hypothetical protein [Eubacterium sp.]
MFFTADDSIKLNMSRDEAIALFEKEFYDMHKAGYTLSTRIIHTDYNGKKFTGVVDDDGKYTARYIGNVENDRYYRSAPLSKISFDGDEKSACVNIKVKSKYNSFYFALSLLVLVVAIILLAVLFNTSLKIPFIAITAVAVIINIVVLAISKKSVDDVLSEFYYIFKYNNN